MTPDTGLTVRRAVKQLGLAVAAGEAGLEATITGAQASDLLSYVMAHGARGHVWITIQTHPNVVAVAALAGLAAIVISGGFEPEAETLMRADDEEIPLLTSGETSYSLAGKLYELGVR